MRRYKQLFRFYQLLGAVTLSMVSDQRQAAEAQRPHMEASLTAFLELMEQPDRVPTTLPGEVSLNGFGECQLRQPGPVLLLAGDLLSRAHLRDTTPDLAAAVGFGLRLGGVCAPPGPALGTGLAQAPAAVA